MPLYVYTNTRTGKTVEKIVPVAQRDQVPGHRRRLVPPRVNTVGFAEDPHSQAYGIRQGLRDAEEKIGLREMQRQLGADMPLRKVRELWRKAS